jgi:hypothetical protein
VQQLLAGSAIATEMLFACGALWKATPESTYKANSTYNDHPNNKDYYFGKTFVETRLLRH